MFSSIAAFAIRLRSLLPDRSSNGANNSAGIKPPAFPFYMLTVLTLDE
jgi:hypothetical protein